MAESEPREMAGEVGGSGSAGKYPAAPLPGNFYQNIFPGNFFALCRKLLSSYIQGCHIIYLLFENSNIIVHTFSEIYIL